MALFALEGEKQEEFPPDPCGDFTRSKGIRRVLRTQTRVRVVGEAGQRNTRWKPVPDRRADSNTGRATAGVFGKPRQISRGESRDTNQQEDGEGEDTASQDSWTPDGAAQPGKESFILPWSAHCYYYTRVGGESRLSGR